MIKHENGHRTLRTLKLALFPAILLFVSGILEPISAAERPGIPQGSSDRIPFLTHRLKLSSIGGIASIVAGTAIAFTIDEVNRSPVIGAPNGVDRFFRHQLLAAGKGSNLLDHRGTYYTLAGGVGVMVILQRMLARGPFLRESAYEVTVFGVGLMAEVGLRTAVKSTVARRRPVLEFATLVDAGSLHANRKNHLSFYSGHTSTAFYSAAYVDQKVSDLLRVRGLKHYRPLTFLAFYGWASYMAYSRIEIDKHYFTDVLTGGIIGTAWGVWHYRFHHGNRAGWTVLPSFDGDRIAVMVGRVY